MPPYSANRPGVVQPCDSWSGGQAVSHTCCHMVNVLNETSLEGWANLRLASIEGHLWGKKRILACSRLGCLVWGLWLSICIQRVGVETLRGLPLAGEEAPTAVVSGS